MFSCSDAIYDPSTMTANELDALTDWLYPAHCQVFDGVTKDAFRAYVIEPDVLRTRIEVYTDPAGRAIGYTAIHLFERTVSGRRCLVVRMEAGLTSELRSSRASSAVSAAKTLAATITRGRSSCFEGRNSAR